MSPDSPCSRVTGASGLGWDAHMAPTGQPIGAVRDLGLLQVVWSTLANSLHSTNGVS